MFSVIKVGIELTINGKKRFKLKTTNNEYYELIEYQEDEEGMFCLSRKSKLFWCNCALSSHITGCRLDKWEDLVEQVIGNS